MGPPPPRRPRAVEDSLDPIALRGSHEGIIPALRFFRNEMSMAPAYSGDVPRQREVSGLETPATGSEAGTGSDSIRLVCPLDEISGIGPARKRALLRAFGSAKALAAPASKRRLG